MLHFYNYLLQIIDVPLRSHKNMGLEKDLKLIAPPRTNFISHEKLEGERKAPDHI